MSIAMFYNNSQTQEHFHLELSALKSIPLPFPLNLDPIWKCAFAISLLATLIEGTKLRRLIILFINSPESNVGPINYLIWVDQVSQ